MKLSDLESQGLIERVEPNLGNVKKALERALKDLRTARATLDIVGIHDSLSLNASCWKSPDALP
jgi:hypothetical protein